LDKVGKAAEKDKILLGSHGMSTNEYEAGRPKAT
jgi:hypothetical protein